MDWLDKQDEESAREWADNPKDYPNGLLTEWATRGEYFQKPVAQLALQLRAQGKRAAPAKKGPRFWTAIKRLFGKR